MDLPYWFERYGRRVEDYRQHDGQAAREAYAHAVGEDGFTLLDALDHDDTADGLRGLPAVQAVHGTWARH